MTSYRSASQFRPLITSAALIAVAFTSREAAGQSFAVEIFAQDGTSLDRFQATGWSMHIDDVEIGPDGNIWIARADNSHSNGVPNPNDMVAVFDFSGTELSTVTGGGMRHPTAVAWDSSGNIYVAGEEIDFTTNMYKYDSAGGFLFKFRTQGWNLIDVYNDVVVTPDDRIYVSAWWGTGAADQMTEFDTPGGTVNTFSPTGPSYFHRDAALASSTVWVRTPRNGPGQDLMREFDLAGNQVSSFVTSGLGDLLTGLRVGANGNLFTYSRNTGALLEVTVTGSLVSTLPLLDPSIWVTDFTFAADGRILVARGVFCPWDLDGDDSVGISDLLALLAAWGTNPGGPPDFNGDGTVGISDLLELLANWGQCP
ncbi:MAG: hypothetical protein ACYS0G_11580 [Planctomycetota bacterium]|jgi:sugar lactone lactonase YvrE